MTVEATPVKRGWADERGYIDRISVADPVVKARMIRRMKSFHNPPYFFNPVVDARLREVRIRLGDEPSVPAST